MTKEYIFELIKKTINEIDPDIATDCLRMEQSLSEIGINSIDRADIIIILLEELNIKMPLVEFGRLKNIESIVELLYEKTK